MDDEEEAFDPNQDFIFENPEVSGNQFDLYEVTTKISLDFWEDRSNVWKWLNYLVTHFEVDAVFYLLELDRKLSIGFSNAPWHWYVLSRPDIFDFASVVLLFKWTSNRFAENKEGKKIAVPFQISIKLEDVFLFLCHLYGEGVESAFTTAEKAFELIRGEPFDITFYQRFREIQFNQDPDIYGYPLDDIFISRIVARNDFAKTPRHILPKTPNSDELVSIIYQESTPDFESPLLLGSVSKEIRDYVVCRPGAIEPYRQEYNLANFRKGLEKSKELCRVFGPANRMANADLTKNDVCSYYGGCRMLLCPHGEGDEDWFLGYCQVCLCKIRFSNWCLRRPKIGGGWTGTFCSFDCLRKDTLENLWEPEPDDLIDDSLTLEEIEIRKNASAIFPFQIIDNVEKIINKHGIYSPVSPRIAETLPDLDKPLGIFEF